MPALKCKTRARINPAFLPWLLTLISREGKMVTQSGGPEKPPVCSFRKISKPLMEKKRRARINVSLEQLKALLEKHYSHQIRKRKLEKADILELSVKYMRSLQHSAPGAPLWKSADYQAGFRSCLQGVNQFLLRSEEACEAPGFHLLQELARALPPVSGPGFSTTDSGARGPRPEQGAHLRRDSGPRPFAQPRARGPPSAQPAERPGSLARTDGPEPGGSREQRPCAPRSQALWRPW